MRKNKLYTVTAANRPWIEKNLFDLGGFTLNSDYNKGVNFGGIPFPSTSPSMSQPTVIGGLDPKDMQPLTEAPAPKSKPLSGLFGGMSGAGIMGAASAIGDIPTGDPRGMWDTADPLFHLADGRESAAGNTISDVGVGLTKAGLQSGQPWLALAGGVTKAFGSLFNAMFGVKENKENTGFVRNNTENAMKMGNQLASVSTNDDLLTAANRMTGSSRFHWNNLYENGWFTSKGTRLGNNLLKKERTALAIQGKGLKSGADNIDSISDSNVMRRYAAFGGPLGIQPMGLGALGIMQQNAYIDAINNRSQALSSSPSLGSFAFGGELGTNGTDFTNGLLYIDAGGTHESNPLGGVPLGVDSQGIPNLVEEDETVFDDYVFSNRMKVPKAFYHEFGLGGVVNRKGITFAEASKKLAKESEQRPNDPISIEGLQDALGKLAAVQEAERMRQQMREYVGLQGYAYGGPMGNMFAGKGNKPNTLNADDLNQSIIRRIFGDTSYVDAMENFSDAVTDPVGYFAGDQLEDIMNRIGDMTEPQLEQFFSTPVGQYVAQGIVAMDGPESTVQEASLKGGSKKLARLAGKFGKRIVPIAKKSLADVRKVSGNAAVNTGKNLPARIPSSELAPIGEQGLAARRELMRLGERSLAPLYKGAPTPKAPFWSRFTPWLGAGTAATLMGLGLVDAFNGPNAASEAAATATPATKKDAAKPAPTSGAEEVVEKLNAAPIGGIPFPTLEETIAQVKKPVIPGLSIPKDERDITLTDPSVTASGTKPLPTWMRYAPAIGAGSMALSDLFGMTNTPDYSEADKIEKAADRASEFLPARFSPVGNYISYNPMDIMYEQNRLDANARATDRAIGNTSNPAKMAGLLASGYNAQLAGSDLYRKALEYNDAKKQQVADFNRRTDMFNSQMGLEAAMANSRMRQQAEATRLAGLEQAAAMRDSIDARISAARSSNLTNMLQSLGNIGRENFIINQINGNGAWRYGIDRSGNTPFKKNRKCGGKINKR